MKLSGKQFANIIVAVLIMTVIANYDDFLPYRWQTFSAADGSFSAQFPGKPEVEDQQVQLPGGGTATVHQVIAAPTKKASYGCTYFEDPRLASNSAEEVLDAARDGSISKIQGSLIHEQRLDVDGHPARDVEVRARGNSLVEMRLVTVGQRTFMLMVVESARRSADSKNVRKFFDSLKFVE